MAKYDPFLKLCDDLGVQFSENATPAEIEMAANKAARHILKRARWALIKIGLYCLGGLLVSVAVVACVILGCLKLFGVI